MPLIKVIIGSTRPGRFGPTPAQWLMELTKEHPNATFELIDLKQVNLPLLDEPIPAWSSKYTQPHTKEWAKIINEADGFIVVTAEYNHGIPAALKNAIDYLAPEWRYKPISFVAYGAASGGVRAVEHLRMAAANLNMFDLREIVTFKNYWEQLDKKGNLQPTDEQLTNAHKVISDTIFWATQLKNARKAWAEYKSKK